LLLLVVLFGFLFSYRGPVRGGLFESALLTFVAAMCFTNAVAVLRGYRLLVPNRDEAGARERSPLSPVLLWSNLGVWRWRFVGGAAVAIAVVSGLYFVENWRGERLWQETRRELEAKGHRLDAEAFIPPRVPDGENFFKAPRMEDWFKGRTGEKRRWVPYGRCLYAEPRVPGTPLAGTADLASG
jgi:hypothetical protein